MGIRPTSGTKPTSERIAEIENAHLAARDLARDGNTDRRCLTCGGELVVEEHGTSYLVRCKQEGRVVSTARGI
jgi:hypothetical protein